MSKKVTKKLALGMFVGSAVILGFSSNSLVQAAPNAAACERLLQKCMSGNQSACGDYARWCSAYPYASSILDSIK